MSRISHSVIMLIIIFVMMGFSEKAVSEADEPRSMEAVNATKPRLTLACIFIIGLDAAVGFLPVSPLRKLASTWDA